MRKHPEQRNDEIFLQNATEADFNYSAHQTKRLGITAYDILGAVVPGLKPMFVSRAELAENIGEGGVANLDEVNDAFFSGSTEGAYYER